MMRPAIQTNVESDDGQIGVRQETDGLDIVVIIDAGPRARDIRLEGCGDRLLLFWKETCALFSDECDTFGHQHVVSHHGRAIRLPMDLNFAKATSDIGTNKIEIRIPKCTRC